MLMGCSCSETWVGPVSAVVILIGLGLTSCRMLDGIEAGCKLQSHVFFQSQKTVSNVAHFHDLSLMLEVSREKMFNVCNCFLTKCTTKRECKCDSFFATPSEVLKTFFLCELTLCLIRFRNELKIQMKS